MFRYETHLHTCPVSKCARSTVEENLKFYKSLGYDGVFITNHFLDGNINIDKSESYEDKINFYFSDYELGLKLSSELGIKVFCGVEISYKGTDFLIYGLDKEWYLSHPEILEMKKSEELKFLMKSGALVIQAHPYREASYIDHIRLFPRCVHGVEVINTSQKDFELRTKLSEYYADAYGLLRFAGSDNHSAEKAKLLAGLEFSSPISSARDFCARVLAGEGQIFKLSFEGGENNG